MIIDEKGKLFGKISVIDILIVCVILAGIFGVYYKFGRSKTANIFIKPDRIETVLYAEELADYAAKAVKAGTEVKDRVTGSVFGKITKVEVGPSIEYANDMNGKNVKSTKENYSSIKIYVEGNGSSNGSNGANFNGMDYYINKSVEIKAGNVAIFLKIMDLRRIKE